MTLAPITPTTSPERWSAERAQAWYDAQPWLVGCNYIPADAVNQLQMWQAETFNPERIDRELAWAQDLGFNTLRVYLHHALWQQNAEGFVGRVDRFVSICGDHGIRPMLVLLDDVWSPTHALGPQPAPRPGVHNSGWLQSPGRAVLDDESRWGDVERYVVGVVGRFRDDPRVLAWDVYNEPGAPNNDAIRAGEAPDKADKTRRLLARAFDWTRAADPTQPLTAGVWATPWDDPATLSPLNQLQLGRSDVISFHAYHKPDEAKALSLALRRYGRPLLCTEYMARPMGSTFAALLPFFKEQKIAAYNWGFVAGRTNTIHGWGTWDEPDAGEPAIWFHDVLRPDGTPYDPAETDLIRRLAAER